MAVTVRRELQLRSLCPVPPCLHVSVVRQVMTDPYIGRKVRFGVAGCGAIGPTHVAALAALPDAEVVAVADPLLDRAAEVAGRHALAHNEQLVASAVDLEAGKSIITVSTAPFVK